MFCCRLCGDLVGPWIPYPGVGSLCDHCDDDIRAAGFVLFQPNWCSSDAEFIKCAEDNAAVFSRYITFLYR